MKQNVSPLCPIAMALDGRRRMAREICPRCGEERLSASTEKLATSLREARLKVNNEMSMGNCWRKTEEILSLIERDLCFYLLKNDPNFNVDLFMNEIRGKKDD